MDSPEFHATDAQRAFLQFVVGKTLDNQVDIIKGYTIATKVFGRNDDFDQARDPIVSIQANKLRRALERYYLVDGYNDPVQISIPKGTYVPDFIFQPSPSKEGETYGSLQLIDSGSWPTIIVQSLDNQTGGEDLEYIGVGIATEIALEITRYQEIRVLRANVEEGEEKLSAVKARFILGGSIRQSHTSLKVVVNLTDLITGIQVWADEYQTDLDPTEVVAFEEDVAKTIAGKILCECGIITKTLSHESIRTPPAQLKSHQAILRFYQFSSSFTAQSFIDSYQALTQACRNEPDCGLIWSMLARLYAINYSLELFDLPTSLEEAAAFALTGVRLEPANQRVRYIKAFVLLFKNELNHGLIEAETALKFNPNSLICMESIGYLMTLFCDWERGPALIKKAIGLNPYYNTTVHYALWLDWVRREEYERAYEETLNFARPALFWDPLLKTAILGLLGRYEEGKKAVQQLMKLKPDFENRGPYLIRQYVKEEALVLKIITGLQNAGLGIS